MSKIISKTTGAVTKATGGAKVSTHKEPTNMMSVGATRNATGGAAVKTTPQKPAHDGKAMRMSQPPSTTGWEV